jgi:rubrerythrin
MSDNLSGIDIINIAIGIERRGISFYDVMAKSADNEVTRDVFEGLVSMEREHLETFQNMLDEITGATIIEDIKNERSDYIQALVDSAVFTDELITGEMAAQADTDIKAIELGISAEKDSLLFYYEIKDCLPEKLVPLIDRVIAEEKMHLQQLSEVKRVLAQETR